MLEHILKFRLVRDHGANLFWAQRTRGISEGHEPLSRARRRTNSCHHRPFLSDDTGGFKDGGAMRDIDIGIGDAEKGKGLSRARGHGLQGGVTVDMWISGVKLMFLYISCLRSHFLVREQGHVRTRTPRACAHVCMRRAMHDVRHA